MKKKIEQDTKRKIGNLSEQIAQRLASSTALLAPEEGLQIIEEKDEEEKRP